MDYFQFLNWFMLLIAISGAYLNSKKDINGFFCWSISNSYFMAWNIYIGQYFQGILFAIFLFTSLNGILKWKKKGR